MSPPQIIAMGGLRPELPRGALERYVLAQADAPAPAVGFLATAQGDSDTSIRRFYETFAALDCRPSHLPLFARTPALRPWVEAQDVIYVAGGNTKSLLGVWREWGLDDLLRDAWHAGCVLAGFSAGAICWFEKGVSDSFAGELVALPGLGFLAGSLCPHYDGEPERRPAYRHLVASGAAPAGHAADDGTALHFVGKELRRIVTVRAGARAYAVARRDGAAVEEPLPAELLSL